MLENRGFSLPTADEWAYPVSYTHLDVYKRQELTLLNHGQRTLDLRGTSIRKLDRKSVV